MKTPTTGMIAALGISALLVAGCGSSSKTSSATTAAASTIPATTEQSSTAAASATPASGATTIVLTKHASKLGTIVAAGPKKLTVYMFEGDKGASSSCSGACASVWPPVTTSTSPSAVTGANSAFIGTIKRSDGTIQVTYKGHPLYYFERDKDSGDAYGQGVHGFGADWYVLKPSGNKVDDDDDDDSSGGSDDS